MTHLARLLVTALVLPFALAAPAAARDPAGPDGAPPSFASLTAEAPLQVERRGFSLPLVEYSSPGGARVHRRGIILGQEIAPGTLIGVGLFHSLPKARGFVPDQPPGTAPKRSRRAAVGVTFRF